jgi:hypothetical protein
MKTTATSATVLLTIALLCGALCCRCREAAPSRRPGREPRHGSGSGVHDHAGEGMVEDDGHGVDAAAPLRTEPQGSWPLAGDRASHEI